MFFKLENDETLSQHYVINVKTHIRYSCFTYFLNIDFGDSLCIMLQMSNLAQQNKIKIALSFYETLRIQNSININKVLSCDPVISILLWTRVYYKTKFDILTSELTKEQVHWWRVTLIFVYLFFFFINFSRECIQLQWKS